MTTEMKVLGNELEILVYHSGKKRYTAKTNNKMGMLNRAAIGKPFSIFPEKETFRSLSFSQYLKNALSFSDNMVQN